MPSAIAKPRIPPKADDVRSLREQEVERRLAGERRAAERRTLETALGSAEQAADRARAGEIRAREALHLAVKERRAAEVTLEARRKALSDYR